MGVGAYILIRTSTSPRMTETIRLVIPSSAVNPKPCNINGAAFFRTSKFRNVE
ncbi:hypothetical protein D3C79_1071260 [compost metagenome]